MVVTVLEYLVSFLSSVLREIYQTLETVFSEHIFKHLEALQNTWLHVVFSSLLVFGSVFKHSLLCLIYYVNLGLRLS